MMARVSVAQGGDDKVFSIVSTLEAACCAIESDIRVINEDVHHVTESVKRYGDIFVPPLRYLTQLRENKILRFREIIGQLEALKTQMDCSVTLLASLNASKPVTIVQPSSSSIQYPLESSTVRSGSAAGGGGGGQRDDAASSVILPEPSAYAGAGDYGRGHLASVRPSNTAAGSSVIIVTGNGSSSSPTRRR